MNPLIHEDLSYSPRLKNETTWSTTYPVINNLQTFSITINVLCLGIKLNSFFFFLKKRGLPNYISCN